MGADALRPRRPRYRPARARELDEFRVSRALAFVRALVRGPPVAGRTSRPGPTVGLAVRRDGARRAGELPRDLVGGQVGQWVERLETRGPDEPASFIISPLEHSNELGGKFAQRWCFQGKLSLRQTMCLVCVCFGGHSGPSSGLELAATMRAPNVELVGERAPLVCAHGARWVIVAVCWAGANLARLVLKKRSEARSRAENQRNRSRPSS